MELPTHRIILAHRSPIINEALLKRPETEVLEFFIPDWRVHSFWRVLQYMYKETYSESSTELLDNIGWS